MFDPEKVARYDNGPSNYALARNDADGDYVTASDYDQLLQLYRKERQSAESYANALQYGE